METALARSSLGAFFTNTVNLCIPTTPSDALDTTGATSPRDATLLAQASELVCALLLCSWQPLPPLPSQVGVRRFTWSSSVVNARAATLSGGTLGGLSAQVPAAAAARPCAPAALSRWLPMDALRPLCSSLSGAASLSPLRPARSVSTPTLQPARRATTRRTSGCVGG